MWGDEQGLTLILVALLFPLLLVFMGIVIDGGMALSTRRELQNAADAASLAAAQDLPNASLATAVAQDYAEGNGFGDGVDGATVTVTVVTPYQGDAMAVEVTVTAPPSYVIHDFGNRSARAVARSVPGGSGGYALLTLNEDECRSYDKSGSGLLDIQGGGIMVNSACNNPSNGALNGVGSGDVQASMIHYYYEGTETLSGSGVYTPWPEPYGARVPDPLASLTSPGTSPASISPDSGGTAESPATLHITGSGPTVIQPGVYYGGIQMSASGNLVFASGIYVMAGGGFVYSGSGDLNGNGVMIYNTNDPYAPQGIPASPARCQRIDLRGSGNKVFTGPASGPYTDIVFWQDIACDKSMTLEGSGDSLGGVIYLPGAELAMSGSGNLGPVQIIVDTFDLSGSGNIAIEFANYVIPGGDPVVRLLE